MKMWTAKIQRVTRIILWSLVGLLLLFLSFMSGGALVLYSIEQECLQRGAFATQEGTVFICMSLPTIKKKEGEMS